MRRFIGCLAADLLKLRRTPVALLLVVGPYVVVLFFGLFAYFDGQRFLSREQAWLWLGDAAFTFWSLVILPMWTALVTAQVAAIEHRAQGFKHLFALPVPRSILYLTKQTLCWLLVAAAFLCHALGVVVAGWLLRWLHPGLGFEAPVPFERLLIFTAGGFVASCFLVAIQTWLALERGDLVTPIAVGFLATVSALALRGFDASLVVYHPWAYPAELVGALVAGEPVGAWALAGVVGGGLFAGVAGWSFVRRDVL